MWPRITFSGVKETFFDSSTLVYICLNSSSDSSTLVFIGLYSSSDLYMLVYIHLWLVYTRLETSMCFKNRSFLISVYEKIQNLIPISIKDFSREN